MIISCSLGAFDNLSNNKQKDTSMANLTDKQAVLKKMVLAKGKDTKSLVVYFSRIGQQYSVGNITEGNTAIVGKMIAKETNADIFEIKVVKDEYPTNDYTALTQIAKKEKQQNARPAIIGKVENFDKYDVIFIGYPNWWADMPMPVYTFLDSYDFTGKTIAPFCTHEGSGLSGTESNFKSLTKAQTVANGLAIYGHTAQNNRAEAENKVKAWLKGLGY